MACSGMARLNALTARNFSATVTQLTRLRSGLLLTPLGIYVHRCSPFALNLPLGVDISLSDRSVKRCACHNVRMFAAFIEYRFNGVCWEQRVMGKLADAAP